MTIFPLLSCSLCAGGPEGLLGYFLPLNLSLASYPGRMSAPPTRRQIVPTICFFGQDANRNRVIVVRVMTLER